MTPLNHALIRYNSGHAVAHMLCGRLGSLSRVRQSNLQSNLLRLKGARLFTLQVSAVAIRVEAPPHKRHKSGVGYTLAAPPGGLCQGHVAAGLRLLETGK